jgi:hypothetical protein
MRPSPSLQHCRAKSKVEGYAVSGFTHEVYSNDDFLGFFMFSCKFFKILFRKEEIIASACRLTEFGSDGC